MTAPKQAAEGLDFLPAGLQIMASEQGTTSTLEFDGEWCLAERDRTRAEIERALERGPECLVLDLSRVSFIDSSGIHVTVTAAKRCGEQGVHLVILPGPPQVHRVFEICQLTHLLPFATLA